MIDKLYAGFKRKFIGITKSTDPTQARAPWRIAYIYMKDGLEYAYHATSKANAIEWVKEHSGVELDPKTLKPIPTPEVVSEAKEPWQMTKAEDEALYGKPKGTTTLTGGFSPHREAVRTAINQGKPVPPEVLAEYPDLTAKSTVKGEQAGMLGVPGKYVEQKRPWIPGQMGFESYTKYVEAMDRKYTLSELQEMCRDRGLVVSGSKKQLIARLV